MAPVFPGHLSSLARPREREAPEIPAHHTSVPASLPHPPAHTDPIPLSCLADDVYYGMVPLPSH